ncbi:hypothetical protein T265_05813 [Opisthorchis viverrini]|uniref:Uncharacterized protein n=1 Tax=Opisthorchis viverrini TaxID=6198 RepID=A0A074ZMQ6_OPIVI|nr:hypothetical protein T265_05813 [Opisthorchis viverrini]KER27047.1 hypothetical protein T265_05813 [Opisthorchis viverrini]
MPSIVQSVSDKTMEIQSASLNEKDLSNQMHHFKLQEYQTNSEELLYETCTSDETDNSSILKQSLPSAITELVKS